MLITMIEEKTLKQIEKLNNEYHQFNTLCHVQNKHENKSGKLKKYAISVKDAICVKDINSSAGGAMLKEYKPLFHATVVEKLLAEGAIIIGKTAQDANGFGSFSVNVGEGLSIPLHPLDKTRSCGGSSGGAAGFTKLAEINQISHIALGESTGGSIAAPASFCGVYGLTPTYGLVSRYGLMDYANSLDKIGIMAKNINDIELMFNIIKGHDKKDSTSLNLELNKDTKIKKIGVIKETLNVDPEIKDLILSKLDDYELVSLPSVEKYSLATYYILAMAEASTNLAKYCGMRYGMHEELKGNFNEYFSKVRSNFFGKEAKRIVILGTFTRMAGYRDAYYLKAAKVRTLIINEYKKAFKKYDLLVSPTMPIIAPKFSEIDKLTPLENYMMDIMTVGPNLAGLPHISLNAGFKDKMPVGIMFIADHLNDNKLIEVGKKWEI